MPGGYGGYGAPQGPPFSDSGFGARLPQVRVRVVGAKNLIAADRGGTSDPYCKVYVGGGVGVMKKTKVIKKNLNPVWNEEFNFTVQKGPPFNLRVVVYDYDSTGKDDPIGTATVNLVDSLNLRTKGQTASHSLQLDKRGTVDVQITLLSDLVMPPLPVPTLFGGGDIQSLPPGSDFEVTVYQAIGLRAADPDGLSDPYCSLKHHTFMLPAHPDKDPRIIQKQKTSMVPKTLNPFWGTKHVFRFVTRDDVLEIVCNDKDPLLDDVLGRVRLTWPELVNMATPMEKQLWYPMTEGQLAVGIRAISALPKATLPAAPPVPAKFASMIKTKKNKKK